MERATREPRLFNGPLIAGDMKGEQKPYDLMPAAEGVAVAAVGRATRSRSNSAAAATSNGQQQVEEEAMSVESTIAEPPPRVSTRRVSRRPPPSHPSSRRHPPPLPTLPPYQPTASDDVTCVVNPPLPPHLAYAQPQPPETAETPLASPSSLIPPSVLTSEGHILLGGATAPVAPLAVADAGGGCGGGAGSTSALPTPTLGTPPATFDSLLTPAGSPEEDDEDGLATWIHTV